MSHEDKVCRRCGAVWSWSHGGRLPNGRCCEDMGKACVFWVEI